MRKWPKLMLRSFQRSNHKRYSKEIQGLRRSEIEAPNCTQTGKKAVGPAPVEKVDENEQALAAEPKAKN